ncbi:MAG: Coenzyme F420 hydrogenase/dehydrogenase, beta subunit C-terminal domain, partial [Deltaproteobacteria bacterium]|nr:Coenzyme F420 hydrogenase/dehydrogenase, beta subunit C-terminal domain [Deltaproteobacteria bacterium]
MIKTLKEDCFGCTACSAICDFAAISMEKDVEGFVYPIGDQDKCTDCDLCNKVCPAQSESFAKNNTVSPDCFAGWCRDEKIRKESSSGGVFTLLAEYVLDNNGFVCGASFDEDNRLKQVIIDDKKELPKLRGSKYIQCEMGDVFLRIKELLDENKVVLYVGTPCQVAGLHGFLRKDYDTLLSVDLLCHGTPSQKIFDRYMEEVGEGKDEISGISFRDKTTGWSNFSFCFSFDYKKNNVQSKYLRQFRNTRYMVGLTKNLTLRPCCTSCAFATLPRVSDITLGDFWGIDSYDKNLDDDGGTSMILVNNSKGRKLLEKIKPEMATCQAVPLEVAVKRSPILRMPAVVHKNRGSFFKKVGDRSSVINLIERELGRNRVGIMNFHSSNHDFGAVMVAYALSRSVERLGYKPEIVNFVPKRFKGDNSVFDDFRRKFLKRTKLCKSVAELRKLNRFFDKFVVGSGQVWRWHSDYRYFFNWVLGNKSIISYAASFGSDRFVGSEVEKGRIRELLSRFESVSVGEKTAVDICDDTFNVSAEQVLDPTLLLSAQ